MSDTEQEFIRKAAAGDRTAFRRLALEHGHGKFRLAWRVVGKSLAEDIVLEAFIKSWNKREDFRGESSFCAWLHPINENGAIRNSALRG